MSSFLTVILCMWFSLEAYAGRSSGGGNIVVCGSGKKQTGQLLDYYESDSLLDGIEIDLGSGKTVLDKVTFVLKRLAKIDPERASDYTIIAKNFFLDTKFISGKELPDIGDHGYIPLDADCTIKQLAVQNFQTKSNTKRYLINKDYWDLLSIKDKAGLVLHELVYSEASTVMRHQDSVLTRFFNAIISSKEIDSFSKTDYAIRLEDAGLMINYSRSNITCKPYWTENHKSFTRYIPLEGGWNPIIERTGTRSPEYQLLTFYDFNLSIDSTGAFRWEEPKKWGNYPVKVRVTDGVTDITCEGILTLQNPK